MKTIPLTILSWAIFLFGGCATTPTSGDTARNGDGLPPKLAPGDALPVPIVQVQPLYPFDQAKKGYTGSAVIGFVVDQNGNVREPYVIRATNDAFAAAALAAVSRWKFQPGRKAGRPVNVRMAVPLTFDFTDRPPPAAARATR